MRTPGDLIPASFFLGLAVFPDLVIVLVCGKPAIFWCVADNCWNFFDAGLEKILVQKGVEGLNIN